LVKASATNYDTAWSSLFAGGLIQVSIVSSLPGSPNANTLYVVV
jgi:hypothetical protein